MENFMWILLLIIVVVVLVIKTKPYIDEFINRHVHPQIDSFNRLISQYVYKKNLTYREVVAYFSKPSNYPPVFEHGAIVRTKEQNGYLVEFVFLNKENKPVLKSNNQAYGKSLFVRAVDAALEKRFDGTNVLIIS